MKLVVTWFVGVAAVLISGALLAAEAQPSAKILRLCFITFDPGTLQSNRFGVFFQALRDLRYVAGQTISIDYLSAEGRAERFPARAAECVRLEADIIVASTTPGALAAKNATRMIPIVFIGTGDPVGVGLVESLVRPGRNVTGMSGMAPGLSAKRLELLKEAVPRISRVLELSYFTDPIAQPQVNELKNAAGLLGLTLYIHDIRSPDELAAAFDAGAKQRADGLIMTVESIFMVNRARIIQLAARYRLPAMYPHRAFADASGLMSYGIDYRDYYARAAAFVDRILKGAKPADLPVEQARKFELVVNAKTAKALGLTISPSVLLRADQVIE